MTTPRRSQRPQSASPARPTPQWRALDDTGRPQTAGETSSSSDLPDTTPALGLDPLQRRDFLGVMGASLALSGLGLAGCSRKPSQHILPYVHRPEGLVPGRPRYFATTAHLTGTVIGLLVESQDGRPTKIEGNPSHPMSGGATDTFAQASVLDLYAPTRLEKPQLDGKPLSARQLEAHLQRLAATLATRDGAGLAVLVQDSRSPTEHRLVTKLRAEFPHARVFRHDLAFPRNALAGAALVGHAGARPRYALEHAERILTLDADILGLEGDTVRQARAWADQRRMPGPDDVPNRLYVVEPTFTITGMQADNRLRLAPSQIVGVALSLAAQVVHRLEVAHVPPELRDALARQVAALGAAAHPRWVSAVAKDLVQHPAGAIVVVGERQPPLVHALGHLVNSALGALDSSFLVRADPLHGAFEDLEALAGALSRGRVDVLLILGGNPAYDAPADLDLPRQMARAKTRVCLSMQRNETTALGGLTVPQSHFLEAWGDHLASDGTLSIQQPLIAPLFASLSASELLARLLNSADPSGYRLVRETFGAMKGPSDEQIWRRTLHDGVFPRSSEVFSPSDMLTITAPSPPDTTSAPTRETWGDLTAAIGDWRRPAAPTAHALELVFQLDASVYDGRFATNAWLQELPDPLTKLTWDNALLVGPATARRLGLASERIYELTANGCTLEVAAWVTPGVADHCLVLPLGYGRSQSGPVADGRGFDANCLRTAAFPWFVPAVTVRPLNGRYPLATTQQHGTMTEPDLGGRRGRQRPVAMEATLEQFRRDPLFSRRGQRLRDDQLRSLWTHPNETGGPQWGMSIDLGTCIGCNACTAACQAENSIPVVGKARVLDRREMHWLRLDRYFVGDADEPEVVHQPMACAHCETAPCESVCPVAATAHSPDGLNDMAYNRCIGTRYCSNNCPYKVRRFNFFNYQRENSEQAPLRRLQLNPDVTVRFRGVMEKCTYCIQRINAARINAKVAQTDRLPEGSIVPACQQVCPTGAIVFGDLSDPQSPVSRLKRQPRSYALLADLNLHPRTTFLAKIRNPNPELC